MSTAKEKKIEVYVDNEQLKLEETKRPDVIRAVKGYGTENENPTPGYEMVYDCEKLKDGTHTVIVKVIDTKTGEILNSKSQIFNLEKYKATAYLETTKSNIIGNSLDIEGWAMSSVENEVVAYVDGKQVNVERYSRSDVLKTIVGYGSREENPTPGFKGTVDVSNLKDGNHNLTIEVKEKTTGKKLTSIEHNFKLDKYKTIGIIDYPASKSTIKGSTIDVSGWVMTNDVNAKIYIKVDNYDAPIIRSKREDVIKKVKNYGDELTNPTPGFSSTFDVSNLKDGTHIVNLKVIDTKTNEKLFEINQQFNLKKYVAIHYIESPTTYFKGTELSVEGWVLSNDENVELNVVIDNDNNKVDINRYFRSDVIKAISGYGTEMQNPTPGYKGIINVNNLHDGEHKVIVQLKDIKTGETLLQEIKKFNLKKYNGKIYIDEPSNSSMYTKNITFIGWEMSESIDSTINTYIDNNIVNTDLRREKRDDVLQLIKNYGDSSVNPAPGFNMNVDLTKISNGKHNIVLKLTSKYGDVLDTYTKEIYVYNNVDLGIDVSKHNGNITWKTVKMNGVNFSMIRAGYRGYGTANLVEDESFSYNIINANKAGIRTGVYFFSQATNYIEGVQEAEKTIDIINSHNAKENVKLPVAIDTEYSTEPSHNGRADHISKDQRTLAVLGFCQRISQEGYTPIIYASKDWIYNNLNILLLSNYQIWLAHYTYSVDIPSDYAGIYKIWQYTSSGSIGGINGNVDLNIMYS